MTQVKPAGPDYFFWKSSDQTTSSPRITDPDSSGSGKRAKSKTGKHKQGTARSKSITSEQATGH